MNPDTQLARVRALALAMPGAVEKLSHGCPAFFVEGGKAFAYFRHDHHGDGETAVIVNTADAAEQVMLIDMDPDCYFRPSHLGAAGWVAMRLDRADADWDRVGDRIAQSWEMAAPPRLLEAGGR